MLIECKSCHGTGKITYSMRDIDNSPSQQQIEKFGIAAGPVRYISSEKTCSSCNGDGCIEEPKERKYKEVKVTCVHCEGTGHDYYLKDTGGDGLWTRRVTKKEKCSNCNGSGKTTEKKEI